MLMEKKVACVLMLFNFSGKRPFPDGQINICRAIFFCHDTNANDRVHPVRGDENLDKWYDILMHGFWTSCNRTGKKIYTFATA